MSFTIGLPKYKKLTEKKKKQILKAGTNCISFLHKQHRQSKYAVVFLLIIEFIIKPLFTAEFFRDFFFYNGRIKILPGKK